MNARSLEFIIPGDLDAPTGGYGYDRRMITGLRALGWRVTLHSLDASFPDPTAAALEQSQTVFAQMADDALVLVDGLALGAMPRVVQSHAARLRLLALVHHPLAAETGLSAPRAQALLNSERRALREVRHVIVTSAATRGALSAYGVDQNRVSVVTPGTDPAPLTHSPRGPTLKMLCVGAVTHRKGHDVLCDALAQLPPRWQLTCVGSLARSPHTVERLQAQQRRLGLDRQITMLGEVPDSTLAQCYRDADLFILASRFEGYGMAVAEALAHGLPVISTRVGAIAELVGAAAGIVVAPDDAQMLAAALERVLTHPELLRNLARGAASVRDSLPRWPESCARLSAILEKDYRMRRMVVDDAVS